MEGVIESSTVLGRENEQNVENVADLNTPANRLGGTIETLTLQNFKSYGSAPVVFGPFQRFNAIIGPNGSGKSNFMEALSFVLGLQSRDLRGTNMKDLIYRREDEPDVETLGRSASVTMVFKGTDSADRLTFRRHISPAGKSQFEIDGHVISAEAYAAKLATLNVLTKARNFLVFQGDVEDIAQRDAKEMTKLFEQVSGSWDLKEEFDGAEAAFNASTQELKYLNIQKSHLELLRKDFKRQVEEAVEYDDLEKTIRDTETSYYLLRLLHNETCREQKRAKLEECGQHQVDAECRKAELTASVRKADASHQTAVNIYEAALKEQTKYEKKLTAERKEFSTIVEKLKFADTRKRQVEKRYDTLAAEVKRQTKYRVEIEAKIETLQVELNAARKAAEAAENDNPVSRLNKTQRAAYEAAKRDATGLVDKNRHAQVDLESQARTINAKIGVAAADFDELSSMENEARLKLADAARSLKSTEAAMSDNTAEHEESCRAAEASEAQRQCEKDRVERLRSDLQGLYNEFNSMHNLQRETFKAQKTRQIVESMKQHVSGVKGVLSELCTPNNRKLNAAVQAALGKYSDHIIVDTWSSAKSAIEFLKQEHHHSLDFIPLDNIPQGSFDPRLRELGGSCRPALDCVNFPSEVRKALELALSDCVIVNTLEEARQLGYVISKQLGISLKVVTLEGDRILKNGNITFDTSARQRNTFDAKESRNLQKNITEMEKLLRDAPSQEQSEAEAFRLKQKSDRLAQHLSIQRTRLKHWQTRVESRQSDLTVAMKLRAEKEAELTQLRKEQKKIDENLKKAVEDSLKAVKGDFEIFSSAAGVEDIRLSEEKALESHKRAKEAEIEIERRITTNSAELKKLDLAKVEDAASLNKEKTAMEREIEILQLEKAKMEKSNQDLEQTLESGKLKASGLLDAKKAAEKEIGRLKNQMRDVQTDIITTTSSIASLNSDIVTLVRQGKEIIRQSCADAVKLPLLKGTEKRLRLSVGLDQNTQTLGAHESQDSGDIVDMDSDIEIDFSNVPRKHRQVAGGDPSTVRSVEAAISQQLMDLRVRLENKAPNNKARDKLADTTTELEIMEARMKDFVFDRRQLERKYKRIKEKRVTAFMQCFTRVRSNIDRIYNFLTGGPGIDEEALDAAGTSALISHMDETVGGQAFLELEEVTADLPFTVGIKFHTMPPSKRFRDMQLLSGGEKTMAALALVFALQSYRPAPFVVLDEVDAALDPENVAALTKYLSGTDFQVLIISLKEKLYSQADCLFGTYKNLDLHTSSVLSLDMTQFPTTTTAVGKQIKHQESSARIVTPQRR